MKHFHSSRSNAATCGILNIIKAETVEVQATTAVGSSHEQAMGNREAREVRHL